MNFSLEAHEKIEIVTLNSIKIQKILLIKESESFTFLTMCYQINHSSASYNNLIQKKKIKIPMEKHQTQCFICGNSNCEEDTDHKKITYYQFHDLLRTKAGYEPQIVKVKHKIRKCFNLFQQTINTSLEPYVNDLFLMVDKLHFWHLMKFSNNLRDIQSIIFGTMLPRSQIIKLLQSLNMETDHNVKFPKFDKLLQEIHKFKKIGNKVIQQGSYGQLIMKLTQIIDQCEREFQKDQSLKRQQNSLISRNAGIPTLHQEQSMSQFVIIQGIPFSTQRKNVDLSVLELTDQLMLGYYSSLQKMRGLTQLQIRNNRLSQRSYKMLLSCFPNLQSLDLSSSNSDNFFSIIGEKIPSLRTLYVNQTSLTDEKLQKMLQKLPNVRVIYADDNQISNQGVQKLFKNKKQIVYASLKGNKLTDQFALKLQINLVFKGGYLEY